MTRSSSRIDPPARRLLSAIAGTRDAWVSGLALAQMRGAGRALIDAGLLVPHGSSACVVAEDDLDDTPAAVIAHPLTGRAGYLGHASWQEERHGALRRVHALDMMAAARRVVSGLDCTLESEPVAHLKGTALEFGTARLPRRTARVGVWVARGLTRAEGFEAFRDLVQRRPSGGLRVVIVLDRPARKPFPFVRGHEFVFLEDVVNHEDGLAAAPEILVARLMMGSDHKRPVWVSGDGGVLIVHGKWHEFTGAKQKIAVAMLAEAWLDGDPVLPVARVLEEAECGPSVRRLKDLFAGHPTWREVIRESGSNCWLEV